MCCHPGFTIPRTAGPIRDQVIARFVNINTFTARLVRTGLPVFNFRLFGLWTMRQALEYSTPEALANKNGHPDAFVPAVAAWISVVGSEMYGWENEWQQGRTTGAPGRGGPLWIGKHGFCRERWVLWRRRLVEVAEVDDGLSTDVRSAAGQAAMKIKEIETAAVAGSHDLNAPLGS